jgi:phage tail sheath protein FI
MTQDDIRNGRLICEIAIAPARPEEFVIFRIFQHAAREPAIATAAQRLGL